MTSLHGNKKIHSSCKTRGALKFDSTWKNVACVFHPFENWDIKNSRVLNNEYRWRFLRCHFRND